jgi:hypothetical protein
VYGIGQKNRFKAALPKTKMPSNSMWRHTDMRPTYSYEFRYLSLTGGVALVYQTLCASDDDARRQAVVMNKPLFAGYEIWRENSRIETGSSISTPTA